MEMEVLLDVKHLLWSSEVAVHATIGLENRCWDGDNDSSLVNIKSDKIHSFWLNLKKQLSGTKEATHN